MPRKAGTSGTYTFPLLDKSDDTISDEHAIELRTVTTIIGRWLASGESLLNWYYTTTVDNIEALLAAFPGDYRTGDAEQNLEEWLEDNEMRPVDVRDERAEVGTDGHEFLEALAKNRLRKQEWMTDLYKGKQGNRAAARRAEETVLPDDPEPQDGYQEGLAKWWAKVNPKVYGAETVVWSLPDMYAGTLDLAFSASNGNGPLVIADYKSRKTGTKDGYVKDRVQVAALRHAWDIMAPFKKWPRSEAGLVLITTEEGEVVEDWQEAPYDTFDALLRIDTALGGRNY